MLEILGDALNRLDRRHVDRAAGERLDVICAEMADVTRSRAGTLIPARLSNRTRPPSSILPSSVIF
jgi:hypothetical protein